MYSGISPSPDHSSDSEETVQNKREFHVMRVSFRLLYRTTTRLGVTFGAWHLDPHIMERVWNFISEGLEGLRGSSKRLRRTH